LTASCTYAASNVYCHPIPPLLHYRTGTMSSICTQPVAAGQHSMAQRGQYTAPSTIGQGQVIKLRLHPRPKALSPQRLAAAQVKGTASRDMTLMRKTPSTFWLMAGMSFSLSTHCYMYRREILCLKSSPPGTWLVQAGTTCNKWTHHTGCSMQETGCPHARVQCMCLVLQPMTLGAWSRTQHTTHAVSTFVDSPQSAVALTPIGVLPTPS
jgi:hypothetical protein